MKRLDNYNKNLISLTSFVESDLVWIKIVESCFFLPEDDWKNWINPWGSHLHFYRKNCEPKLTIKEIDEEKMQIYDIHFFEPFDIAVKKASWIFGGELENNENINKYIYLFDGKYCKLYMDGNIYNPMLNGYQILKLHLDNPKENKFSYKVPAQLKLWSNLFMGSFQDLKGIV